MTLMGDTLIAYYRPLATPGHVAATPAKVSTKPDKPGAAAQTLDQGLDANIGSGSGDDRFGHG